MDSSVKISVVIPSYNHERFIVDAVRSALDQTFREMELIIVDDGSTDRSPELLDAMAGQDSRIKVVLQKNAGSHAALNRGMQLATAPWIAILNSDDVWSPDRLAVMLDAADRSGGDFLFSDSILIDGEGLPITDDAHWWNISLSRIRRRSVEYGITEGLLYGNLTVSTSNFLFRREVLDEVGLFKNYRFNLDWDFALRCVFAKGVKVEFVPDVLLQYRLHGNNTILNGMPLAAIEAQEITRSLYQKYYGVPKSLILSDQRDDRLLRKFLSGKSRRAEASLAAITADRDGLADTLNHRQLLIESERKASGSRIEGLLQDLAAMESSRDELAALIASRQVMVELERAGMEAERSEYASKLDRRYRECVNAALERDVMASRMARVIGSVSTYRADVAAWMDRGSNGWRGVKNRLFHMSEFPSWPAQLDTAQRAFAGDYVGTVREAPGRGQAVFDETIRTAVHVHLYYKELVSELVEPLLQVPGLHRVVITGPWDEVALAPHLEHLREVCPDVRVDKLPNRGKDVGGFFHAMKNHELLDSDCVLKIHSKKSHNHPTYFEAISVLFGTQIKDGDQWRRALIDPLTSSKEKIMDVLHWFKTDPTVGMVGAGPFITAAPDSNFMLYDEIASKLGIRGHLPFLAGTMFWARSSLFAPLLDSSIELNDFEIDSRKVEGSLEHVMERVFGALVLSEGFDLLKARS